MVNLDKENNDSPRIRQKLTNVWRQSFRNFNQISLKGWPSLHHKAQKYCWPPIWLIRDDCKEAGGYMH